MRLIRKLTDVEQKCTAKYRAQLAHHEAEAQRLRDLLGDMAIAFAGREGPVLMTETELHEPESAHGS